MRWDVVGLVLGWTIRLVALPLIIVCAFSAYDDGYEYAIKTYLIPILLAAILGQILLSLSNDYETSTRVRDREAFASVALGWIPVVLIGALPYWFGGTFNGPYELMVGDATLVEVLEGILFSWFESMSGFTTTGATVIDPLTSPICQDLISIQIGQIDCIASQPRSLLLWRSMTQWFGGMGVIMLGLLILSRALGGGMSFARAELTGPTLSRLRPTLQSTAQRLWTIYIILTLAEMILLFSIGNMNIFDSINYALTTLPTGGFGTSDMGVMSFDSIRIEFILTIFMILAGINFSLYHMLIIGEYSDVIRDEELRTYLFIFILAWIGMAINLMMVGIHEPDNSYEAFRHSMFQAASIGTSTGFASSDFAQWPVFSLFVLLLLMIVGASAGSTGGGVKVMRIRVAFELVRREIQKIIQPKKIIAIRLNEETIDDSRIWVVLGMLSSWMVLAMASILVISMLEVNMDMETVLSVVISSLGNTGPALGSYGPTQTWASMGTPSLMITSLLMWLGRLELLTVLVLLHPRTWTKD
jgi:trk system potassium uptake protein TrkH